jgi:hypothetical protein
MTQPESPALLAAAEALGLAQHLVDQACATVRKNGGIDANQVVAYDVAHAAAAVATAQATLEYGARGEIEERIATAFVADVLAELCGRVAGREGAWGVEAGWSAPAAEFLAVHRDPAVLAALATTEGPRHLGEDFELVRRPSTASPRRRCGPTPSTCTAPTATSPKRSSAGWPSWAASACRSPRSTKVSPAGARATTWAWWWPPRN